MVRAASASRTRPRISTIVLVFFAVSITLAVVVMSSARGWLAWDVRFAYLPAAEAVLDGDSPYPALDDPILEDQKGYVYPPQLLLALVPFTPLPNGVVGVIVAAGLIALLLLTVRLLGIRDVRCYAAALLWVPSLSGVLLGNISIPLAFAAAVAWRYRDEVWQPAWALGLAISAKLLMWPLLVWTVATRRLRATAWAVAIGVGVTLAAWAAIGFDGLTGYPDLLRRLSEIQSERSYSLVGMASTAGARYGGRSGADADRRRRVARRVRRLRAALRRSAFLHLRRRRDARTEPDRVAPLPRRPARSRRDRAAALLGCSGSCRCCSG